MIRMRKKKRKQDEKNEQDEQEIRLTKIRRILRETKRRRASKIGNDDDQTYLKWQTRYFIWNFKTTYKLYHFSKKFTIIFLCAYKCL